MKDLARFIFDGAEVRIIDKDGNAWFILSDVCAVLGIANPRDAATRLDADERDGVGISDAIGRNQRATIVSESGVYRLIFTSTKKNAKKFRKWVTSEVLPAIRKHGGYISKGATTEQIAILEHQLKEQKKISNTFQGHFERVVNTCAQHTVYDYCILQKRMKLSYDQVQQIYRVALDISAREGTPFPTARHFDNEPVMIFRTHVLDRAIKLWKVNYK
jgi:prophage antirepressor-like protein